MKFGICYCYWNKDWEGKDYPKYIERARKCGFDGLEIFYGRTLEMDGKEVADIKAACAANDIEMYISGGYGRELDISQPDEAGRKAAVAQSIELATAFHRIGAHNFSGFNYGPWDEVCGALKEIGYDRCISFEPLVRTGGTVALGGGNVWRPMLPENADDEMLDEIIKDSLKFIKDKF